MKSKLRVLIILAILFSTSLVFGDLLSDFNDIYMNKGIDDADVEVLKQGVSPDDIMKYGLLMDGLNPQNLVKAMYCAGIRGEDIRNSGEIHNLTELILVSGYKKSVEECGDMVVDSQAYTPTTATVSFSGPPVPSSGSSASPYKF